MQSHFARAQIDHRRLLQQVKCTVDALFHPARTPDEDSDAQPVARQQLLCTAGDVWSLHTALEAIFMHGLRAQAPNSTASLWTFIQGLKWLNPSMSTAMPAYPPSTAAATLSCPIGRIRDDRALRWLYENLAAGQLLGKLQYLVSDTEHLNNCYEPWAFLQSRRFVGALVLCVRAVETAQVALLAQIDAACLQPTTMTETDAPARSVPCETQHKRSTSHPDFSFVPGKPLVTMAAAVAVKPIPERLTMQKIAATAAPEMRRSHSAPNLCMAKAAGEETCPCSPVRMRRSTLTMPSGRRSLGRQTVPTFTYKPQGVGSPKPSPAVAATSFSASAVGIAAAPATTSASAAAAAPVPKRRPHSDAATVQLQPISLVRCDDIKIHFDRKHADRVSSARRTSASSSSTATSTATTPTPAIPIERPSVPQSLLYTLLPMLSKSPTATTTTPDDAKSSSDTGRSPSLVATLFATTAPSDFVNAFIPREGEKLHERRSLSSLSSPSAHQRTHRDAFELFAADELLTIGEESGGGGGEALAASSSTTVSCSQDDHHFSSQGSRASSTVPLRRPPSTTATIRASPEQSLTRFLQSAQFSCANSDLERENAHFSVSEAMISAIEQMKCRKVTAMADCDRRLLEEQQRQRRQRDDPVAVRAGGAMMGVQRRGGSGGRDTNDKYRRAVMSGGSSASSSTASTISSPGSTPSLRTPHYHLHPHRHHTHQPSSSVSSSEPYSSSPDEVATTRIATSTSPPASTSTAATLTPPPSSSSSSPPPPPDSVAAPLECRAYAEWGATRADTWSAESVALSLIAQFSDQQLPKAADLLWLVSEQDAPQKLLPLPGSRTIDPDEPYKIPFTRGTRDWAPPRAQIIFTPHASLSRTELLQRQNHRCAGCGMRVAAAYAHRFRYCEYLGRYHCTNCHRNQIAVIPARVLAAWDFGSRPVSVFAYRLLEQIGAVPVFRVRHLNAPLYDRVRALRVACALRSRLRYVRDFVVACRFAAADGTAAIFEQVAVHIVDDLEAWSMSDFQAVRAGSFARDIGAVMARCEQHVRQCVLCNAHGFVCEHCVRKQPIFPWQPKVRRCAECGACVHEACWPRYCTRCERLRVRRVQLQRSNSTVVVGTDGAK